MSTPADACFENSNRELDTAITRMCKRFADGEPFDAAWADEKAAIMREGNGQLDPVQLISLLSGRLAMATLRLAHHRRATPATQTADETDRSSLG
jgi:hypothetical protein